MDRLPGRRSMARLTAGIAALWRGEVALVRTYWLFTILGGIILVLPFLVLLMALTEPPEDSVARWFLAYLAVILLYGVWVLVGTWRSASNYQGNSNWALLAKICVVVEICKAVSLAAAVLFMDAG